MRRSIAATCCLLVEFSLGVPSFALKHAVDPIALQQAIAPPAHLPASLDARRQREIARLLERSNVRHVVRLRNTSPVPLTTAPATVMHARRIFAQGLMTYAAPGAPVDLELTDAVDVAVEQHERETERVMNERELAGSMYQLVRLRGDLAVTNRRDEPVRLEITRFVLGTLDDASEGVEHESASVLDDRAYATAPDGSPWWGWYDWPWWWMRVNGPQRIAWRTTLAPGEEASIRWDWHYYWR